MNSMRNIVLDTNCLIQCIIPRNLKWRTIMTIFPMPVKWSILICQYGKLTVSFS